MYFKYANLFLLKSKKVFTCLFSVHNVTSLSNHEQVCFLGIKLRSLSTTFF